MMESQLFGKDLVRFVCQTLTFLLCFNRCLAKKLPANFVFGDSLVDVGNNNYIFTISKSNYDPNGIDFGKPTGRFTNERTIVDILGNQLGLKNFTPPYLAPTTIGSVVLQGVNYASGGGGIVNETGAIFIGRINLDAQLDNFANTRQYIISSIGTPAAMKLLNSALYSVTMGSNDLINNYFIPFVSTIEQRLVSPEAFIQNLISRFRIQLTRLYEMGARKIVVANVGPIGCIPYIRDVYSTGDACASFPNRIARNFNNKVKRLVDELTGSHEGSMFVYADVYNIVLDIVQNYVSYGFENRDSACCREAGQHGGLIPCGPGPRTVCSDRTKYVFWDPYHPSDATNVIIAKRLMDGNSSDISPINVRTLFES